MGSRLPSQGPSPCPLHGKLSLNPWLTREVPTCFFLKTCIHTLRVIVILFHLTFYDEHFPRYKRFFKDCVGGLVSSLSCSWTVPFLPLSIGQHGYLNHQYFWDMNRRKAVKVQSCFWLNPQRSFSHSHRPRECPSAPSPTPASSLRFCLFGVFLDIPHGLKNLSSCARDWTWATAVDASSPDRWTARKTPAPHVIFAFCYIKNATCGTSQVVQWPGIHLSVQGTWVRSPVGTKSPHAAEKLVAQELQLLSPWTLAPTHHHSR